MWKGDNWALLAESIEIWFDMEVGTGLCLNKHVLSCNVSTGARIFCHSCNLYRRMKVKRKLTLCKASRNNHRKIPRASLACNRTLVSCMHYAWSFLYEGDRFHLHTPSVAALITKIYASSHLELSSSSARISKKQDRRKKILNERPNS